MKPTATPPGLIVTFGLFNGTRLELIPPRWVLGRLEGVEAQISDQKISRQHAELRHEGGRWWLVDLNSHNGTFLNGQRLSVAQPTPIGHGDIIQLGSVWAAQFDDPSATASDRPTLMLTRGLSVYKARRLVYVNFQELTPPLPAKLFDLLAILAEQPNVVIPKEQIVERLWPEHSGHVTDAMLDALVARLRKRLARLDSTHDYLVRARRQGLKFVQRPGT